MIPEMVVLLREWQAGWSAAELGHKVVAEGLLPKATSSRVRDIVSRVFAFRYLVDNDRPARQLKRLLDAGATASQITQLLFLHTARAHPELHDFVTDFYWPRYSSGAQNLNRNDSIDFFKNAFADGRLPREWTDTSRTKIARYLLSTLTDFGLAGPPVNDQREILHFSPRVSTSLYLTHDLRFSGLTDNQIMAHPDWRLFGFEPLDALAELKRISSTGMIIVQHSGDLLRIAWKHKTMEAFLDELAQGYL